MRATVDRQSQLVYVRFSTYKVILVSHENVTIFFIFWQIQFMLMFVVINAW